MVGCRLGSAREKAMEKELWVASKGEVVNDGGVTRGKVFPLRALTTTFVRHPQWLPDLLGMLATVVVALLLGSRLLGSEVSFPQDNVAQFQPFRTIAPRPIRNWILQDVAQVFYPNRVFVQKAFAAGQFPLWNPYILTGQPAAADPVMALFYPTTQLFSHLSAAQAFDYEMLLHLLIAATGTYAAVRASGGKPLGGVVAAASFAGCGTLTVWQQYGNIMTCGAWLPWLFLCFTMLQRSKRRLLWIGLGGLTLGLVFLANDVQWLLYDLGLVACYALWMSLNAARDSKRRFLQPPFLDFSILIDAVAIVIVGFGIGAVQFLPELALATSIPRLDLHPFVFVQAFVVPPERLLTLFAPNFFGTPAVLGSEWLTKSNYPESLVYWGFFPLLISLTALLWRRTPIIWFLWGSLLVTASMVFGTPVLHLYAAFPGLNALEVSRMAYLTCFIGAMLCGLTFDRLFVFARAWVPVVILGTLAVGARIMLHIALPRFVPNPPLTLDPTRESLHWMTIVLVIGIALLALNVLRRVPIRQGAALAFGLLLVVDMVHFSLPYNAATVPESSIFPEPKAFAALAKGPIPPRVMPINAKDSDLLLPPNMLETFGIADLGADESLVLPAYGEFLRLIEPTSYKYNGYILVFTDYVSPLIDLAGVDYFVSSTPLDTSRKPLTLMSSEQNMYMYRNMKAAPRAFIVTNVRPLSTRAAVWQNLVAPDFSPCAFATVEGASPLPPSPRAGTAAGEGCVGSVTFTRYEPNRVHLQAETPTEGMLVLTDSYYSDWQVTVDGVSQPILKADGPFRGVHLMPGTHDIRFEFRPAVIYRSAIISGVSAVVALLLIGIGVFAGKRHETSE